MKDYYQILRVGRQASELEIKRAYRRLAVVFHPDKNPSEDAQALFQEINEAHEVLSSPEKRAQYDFILRQGFSEPVVSREPQRPVYHRDPAYRRRQASGYRRPAPRPPEHLLMMAHFLKYLHTICFVGLGWCGILVMDFVLPHRIYEETVVSESNRLYGWRFNHVPYVVVTDTPHQFPVLLEGVKFFPTGSHIRVNTSRIMNLLIKVEAENNAYVIYGLNSVYRNYLFVPVILFVFSMVGLTLKNGIEFRFSFGIAICMIIFFNLIFIFFSTL